MVAWNIANHHFELHIAMTTLRNNAGVGVWG